MSEKKIVVPEGMLKAAIAVIENYDDVVGNGQCEEFRIELIVEAALRWLSENPIVPTKDDLAMVRLLYFDRKHLDGKSTVTDFVVGWQRRMFIAPEPEVPEEIEDLLLPYDMATADGYAINVAIIEAYRRGRSGVQPSQKNDPRSDNWTIQDPHGMFPGDR